MAVVFTLVVAFLVWMLCSGCMIVYVNVSTRTCARTPSHLHTITSAHSRRNSSSRSQSLCVCACVRIHQEQGGKKAEAEDPAAPPEANKENTVYPHQKTPASVFTRV